MSERDERVAALLRYVPFSSVPIEDANICDRFGLCRETLRRIRVREGLEADRRTGESGR